ncbi:Pre-rRNA-processing protein ipi3 [Teratosphaeriaceae sp. CCFEE 6253]|nr:Pre-rRNA-processing protein ipi3 [Teratosphaeriaceae sp. CCFEE 6253]
MLTERFIASIGVPEKAAGTSVAKDAAIFVHELQPLDQQRAIFKKSATAPNCLAVSENHVFAAQEGKAVVHVYNREKGNQEATVPFTERITCLALACKDTVLVLGTAEGRIFLWELCTGRLLTTSQAHLQAVTALAVDPTSNTLLSASADSTVHVWSLPGLLSFANVGSQALSPLQTFTSHRAEVTALAVGHSSGFGNLAISTSRDKTCLIWDLHTLTVVRTYLLPSLPTCVAMESAHRAAYVGYDDGSVQQLDMYATAPTSAEPSAATAIEHGGSVAAPIQPPSASHWKSPEGSSGATLCMSLSFDSSTLLSGHETGTVLTWDVASGRSRADVLQSPLPGPVTNVTFLPVIGLPHNVARKISMPNVVKPRFGAFDSSDGNVPGNYTLNIELITNLEAGEGGARSAFQEALAAPFFSQSLLDEGLQELASWGQGPVQAANGASGDQSEDFMALDDQPTKSLEMTLQERNAALKAQLDAMRRLQNASFDKMEAIHAENRALLEREQARLSRRGEGLTNGKHAGSGSGGHDGDESMDSD